MNQQTNLLTVLFTLSLCVFCAKTEAQNNRSQPGASVKVYHMGQTHDQLPVLAKDQSPNFHRTASTIDFDDAKTFGNRATNFYVQVDALLRIPKSGSYAFRLTSDDGSRLYVGKAVVVNNDGVHAALPKDGSIKLKAGTHPIRVEMFQGGGDIALKLEWKKPGSNTFVVIPKEAMSHKEGKVKTTAGNKKFKFRGISSVRPGAGKPLDTPHPSFTIEQARPDTFLPRVGAMCFLDNGKLAVTSFQPKNNGTLREEYNGTLYIIDNPTEKDPSKITYKKITEDLHDPLGMNTLDGALYISDRNEVSKWTDTDDDGYPDKRETFSSGWISDNYHHFTFGLPYHDGSFYISLSTSIGVSAEERKEGIEGSVVGANGPNPEGRGTCIRIDAKTGEFEELAGGLRTPNGISIGPKGVVLVPDNQGAWKPTSGIYAIKEGQFYGHYNDTNVKTIFYPEGGVPALYSDKPITPPAVYLAQNEISNSPAQMVMIPEGQPFAGQMLMTEITLGGLRRVCLEEVDGVWQGAVFRHSQGFEAGLNRIQWGPDGCLYVGGMGDGGTNWGWRGKIGGIQRLRPTGKTAFEFEKIESTKDGFRVTFTEPVTSEQLEDLQAWSINAWTYKPTPNYGGGKVDSHPANPTKAVASKDGLSVELTVPDRKLDYVYHIRTDPKSRDGDRMWSPEAWFTLHNAPKQ